jgi:hypothetical protein
VKLADFGLAKKHSHAAEAMMTRGIGTPVSPDVWTGAREPHVVQWVALDGTR